MLVHGDAVPEHVLVGPESGAFRGLIDWSDARIDAAAGDFAAFWAHLGEAALEAALAAYGAPDPEAEAARARFAGTRYLIGQLWWAHVAGDEAAGRRSRALLGRALGA